MAHLSDFHVGGFRPVEWLERIVDRVNQLRPDIVVITGDLADHGASNTRDALTVLRRLETRLGCYVVLGNHDIQMGRVTSLRSAVSGMPEMSGVTLVEDNVRILDTHGIKLAIGGISSPRGWWPQDNPALNRRVSSVVSRLSESPFSMLLSHHPEAFDVAASAGVDLIFAGRMHGGQIALGLKGSRLSIASLLTRYPYGVYRKGTSVMNVTSGLGESLLPARFGTPPEIVLLTLRSEAPDVAVGIAQ